MLSTIKKIFTKTDEDLLVKEIIKNEIYHPNYFQKSRNKRCLGNLEEHTQRNGERFYKLSGKVIQEID